MGRAIRQPEHVPQLLPGRWSRGGLSEHVQVNGGRHENLRRVVGAQNVERRGGISARRLQERLRRCHRLSSGRAARIMSYREASASPPSALMRASSAMPINPPAVAFGDRLFSADEMAGIAAGWCDIIQESIPAPARVTALPLSNHPEAIALFFALSTFPRRSCPAARSRAWQSRPPIPAATPIFLPPSLAAPRGQGRRARAAHLRPARIPGRGCRGAAPGALPHLAGLRELHLGIDGTASARVHRDPELRPANRGDLEACRLSRADAVVASLPLSTHYGFGQALLLPTLLGSPLGLVSASIIGQCCGSSPTARTRTGPPRR